MIQHAHKNKVTVLEHVGSQGLPKAIFLFIMEGNSKLYWAPWHRLCWWIPDHHCMITFLLVSIWKRKQFENQGFSLALETSGDSQLLNILLVLVKFCRTQSLHSSCCQELSVLMKRDEQERSTPGAGPMENVFSALGIAGGDLDPRRNAVSFSICGDKKTGLLPAWASLPPWFLWSLWTSVHFSPPCTGVGWVHEARQEGSGEHSYDPQKDSQTLRFACRRSWRMMSGTTPVKEWVMQDKQRKRLDWDVVTKGPRGSQGMLCCWGSSSELSPPWPLSHPPSTTQSSGTSCVHPLESHTSLRPGGAERDSDERHQPPTLPAAGRSVSVDAPQRPLQSTRCVSAVKELIL